MENASATTTVEKGTTVAYVIVVNQQSASQKVLVDRLGGHALLAKTLFLSLRTASHTVAQNGKASRQ